MNNESLSAIAPVGHIRIVSGYNLSGPKLLDECNNWLAQSGWKNWVSVSLENAEAESRIEFVPGQFQSNGFKKMSLKDNATLADFEKELHKWFWEIEESND